MELAYVILCRVSQKCLTFDYMLKNKTLMNDYMMK